MSVIKCRLMVAGQADVAATNPKINGHTSVRSCLISSVSSSHWRVYCHLAVFSLSTICNRCKCFCSSSSFWASSLLKLIDGRTWGASSKIQISITGKFLTNQIFYLACLTAWIQALQSLSDSARSSYERWLSRRNVMAKQYCTFELFK